MATGMTREYHEAVRRLRAGRRFRTHLLAYLTVAAVLGGLNLAVRPDTPWALWPLLPWGVGVLFHAVSAHRPVPRGVRAGQVREILRTLGRK